MPASFTRLGHLISLERLDVRGVDGVYVIGFRIVDRADDLWTIRFNRFKAGVPGAVDAGVRAFVAAWEGIESKGGLGPVVVVGAIPSGHAVLTEGSAVHRMGAELSAQRDWAWRPDLLSKRVHRPLDSLPSTAVRDEEVRGVYAARCVGRPIGIFLVVDDFCTRGSTMGDICRALREANPGWMVRGAALAKTERAAAWSGGVSNDHVPSALSRVWGIAEGRRGHLAETEVQPRTALWVPRRPWGSIVASVAAGGAEGRGLGLCRVARGSS